MSERNDGGPAFPHPERVEYAGAQPIMENFAPGMSLRDHFAGLAMASIIAKTPLKWVHDARLHGGGLSEMTANGAYAYADAMLAERAK